MPFVQGEDDFRPERFLEDGAGREGWIPFGGGKRHCVGSHLALLELEVVVRETVRRLSSRRSTDAPEPARLQHVTLVPADLAVVRARDAAPRRPPGLRRSPCCWLAGQPRRVPRRAHATVTGAPMLRISHL
jgi:hypothetical protein